MLSPTIGRVLSAVGAVVVAVALVLTWYHIDRSALQGTTESTGWQTFTNLRWVILAGAAFVLVTALMRQTRPVLIARTVVGLVLALLILRRIVDPPDLGFPISAQIGVFAGLAGAIAVAVGGLVDSGREVATAHSWPSAAPAASSPRAAPPSDRAARWAARRPGRRRPSGRGRRLHRGGGPLVDGRQRRRDRLRRGDRADAGEPALAGLGVAEARPGGRGERGGVARARRARPRRRRARAARRSRLATTGQPAAIASAAARPNVSGRRDGHERDARARRAARASSSGADAAGEAHVAPRARAPRSRRALGPVAGDDERDARRPAGVDRDVDALLRREPRGDERVPAGRAAGAAAISRTTCPTTCTCARRAARRARAAARAANALGTTTASACSTSRRCHSASDAAVDGRLGAGAAAVQAHARAACCARGSACSPRRA